MDSGHASNAGDTGGSDVHPISRNDWARRCSVGPDQEGFDANAHYAFAH